MNRNDILFYLKYDIIPAQEQRSEHKVEDARREHLDGLEQAQETTELSASDMDALAKLQDAAEDHPLAENVATGRRMLRLLLPEPLTITPVLDSQGRLEGWDYLGKGVLDHILAGRLEKGNISAASPTVSKAYATELVARGRQRCPRERIRGQSFPSLLDRASGETEAHPCLSRAHVIRPFTPWIAGTS